MRNSLGIAALLVGLSAAWAGEPGQRGSGGDKDRAEQLIKKLSSDKFADRERASGELEKLGGDALDALKKALAAKDTDQETRSRAEKILAKLSQKLESATLLAPTKLRLDLKDTPVTEAINQLAKKSGYSIAIQGDTRKLAERKITLDTGETTFWQAFDQVCQKGGLVQISNPYQNPGIRFGNPRMIAPGGAIQIQPLPVAPALPPPPPLKAVPLPVQKNDQAANAAARVAFAQALQVQLLADKKQQAAALPAPAQAPPAPPVIQPFPAGGRPGFVPGGVVNQAGQLNVTDGKAENYPTHYAGAVRFRVVPYDRNTMSWIRDKAAGETLLVLEICAEPKLANFRLSGSPRVDKATDDQGQALSTVMEPMPNVGGPAGGPPIGNPFQPIGNPYMTGTNRELVPVRLKLGEKQAKSLKELAGSVTAECLSPPLALMSIDDVLKSAGKVSKGKDGGAMELVEVSKQDNGDVRLKVRLETVQGANPFGGGFQVMPGGGVQIQQIQIGGGIVGRPGRMGGVGNGNDLPTLEDAKGQAYQLTQMPSRSMRGNGNVFTQEMTLVFRPHAGQGEPARLVLHGRRNAHLRAAFDFKDVNLP